MGPSVHWPICCSCTGGELCNSVLFGISHVLRESSSSSMYFFFLLFFVSVTGFRTFVGGVFDSMNFGAFALLCLCEYLKDFAKTTNGG